MVQSVLTKPKPEIYIKSSFLKAYKKRIDIQLLLTIE